MKIRSVRPFDWAEIENISAVIARRVLISDSVTYYTQVKKPYGT